MIGSSRMDGHELVYRVCYTIVGEVISMDAM